MDALITLGASLFAATQVIILSVLFALNGRVSKSEGILSKLDEDRAMIMGFMLRTPHGGSHDGDTPPDG